MGIAFGIFCPPGKPGLTRPYWVAEVVDMYTQGMVDTDRLVATQQDHIEVDTVLGTEVE